MLVTPSGFLFSGVKAGIKTESKNDLGLIYSEKDAIVGGVFTQNKFPSAHVQYCKHLVPLNKFRALIVNSGNANAATGSEGLERNKRMALSVANKLGIDRSQVLTSSTGIIGHPLPIEKIVDSIDPLIKDLRVEPTEIAEAILTTDTKTKIASAEIGLSGREYSVIGFAKGSGMIHPNMATMLAYVMTDAPIPYDRIQSITAEIAEKSFNRVSVDGDTSTNDSFFLISNNHQNQISQSDLNVITETITRVSTSLAKQIAADGEGAEHLVEVAVSGAPSELVAKKVVNAIITSNLVKTAIHGRDPNWGRILMATGNALADCDIADNKPISISIQDVMVFQRGEPLDFDEEELTLMLGEHDILISVNLHSGDHSAIGWGCDLTTEYVHINADYRT